ncbi:WhiB family transcriptional regulator [Actinoallomurus purpureus]|uniref:WhiB family transcriptional regulator n=1 Tax=Actinoallomurus purpureus TaxID=478114 RepID=UPI0020932F67|nr:WhiB family transcriptional regulator [Actinoallomurus purpureus]MCO6010563.1 WhiB family transcriptional regulator [Actinoallomurus purpureus]
MNTHPSKLALPDLRDECLDGAECLYDPELHDGPDDGGVIEHPHDQAAREDIAKDICGTCPVRNACLDYALRTKPNRGIWAGLTVDELATLTDSRAEHEPPATDRDAYRSVA